MKETESYILDFSQISLSDVALVGGKNASLGQLFNALRQEGINSLDGFATTASAYRRLLQTNGLEERLHDLLSNFDVSNVSELIRRGSQARIAVMETPLPDEISKAVLSAYEALSTRIGHEPEMAVRSSATAEDLPEASFAGQQETYLNVRGKTGLLNAVHSCFASLFTDRAISYRAGRGFDHLQVALSVGVQPMVRSDKGSAGVIFTLDTESGFRDAVVINGSYGLGEFVVQGVVTPDEWVVFKPTLAEGFRPIVKRQLGSKEVKLVYADGTRSTRSHPVAGEERKRFCLSDNEVLKLAQWACRVEEHYSEMAGRQMPMDLEWAKDGVSGELFILQARPETVHSSNLRNETGGVGKTYRLLPHNERPVVVGQAVGEKIAVGRARVVTELSELPTVEEGDVLIAEMTDPDWEPAMRRAKALVTDKGGRTAHAAIVSRELGVPCIVGTENATKVLKTGMEITVSCAEGSEGRVYEGTLPFDIEEIDATQIPTVRTPVMFNVGDPGHAFRLAAIPNSGVGLARIEFIIVNHIGIHPMALATHSAPVDHKAAMEIADIIGSEEPEEFFVRRLSEGVAQIAAAFYPKPVIVRTSDFKTNEYGSLLGGRAFEPQEENPMLGFRGASRYTDVRYEKGFGLECAALARVRQEMGLTNVNVMIPFCRTIAEAKKVIDVMAANGLRQGENGLKILAMCELPANIELADEFLNIFDGYSIGSNDLTQLVLGIDRDSATVAHLFDERDEAVKRAISRAITAAKRAGKPIGICGQAPSDFPEFAAWLVEQGIDSISLNPDSAIKTMFVISEAETSLLARSAQTN